MRCITTNWEKEGEMAEEIIIVKILDSQNDMIARIQASLNENVEKFYGVSGEDISLVSNHNDLECNIVFVVFEQDNDKRQDIVQRLYIGSGNIRRNDNRWNIYYRIKKKIDSHLLIADFVSNSALDLRNDFNSCSYVNIEKAPELITQIMGFLQPSYKLPCIFVNGQNYPEIENEKSLHQYSQFNTNCIRQIGHNHHNDGRGEYQRDYERIIHTKAFRRLVDKAQIFSSIKGDHYRMRMTHTLEVAQISRAIAIGLGINIQLTEAIALAHDLGHTPFGHQGERTLDSILKNRHGFDIVPRVPEEKNCYGGFKHNYQTLRVVSQLEERHINFPGVDLSYQVLEGALKHTKTAHKDCEKCEDAENCSEKCYDINDYIKIESTDYLYLEYPDSTTLEGQVVAIADEIAQRSHDIDDSFSAQLLTTKGLMDHLSIEKMSKLKKKLEIVESEIKESLQRNRQFVDVAEFEHGRFVSAIIDFFIDDVTKASLQNMKDFKGDEFYQKHHRFSKVIIEFSSIGKSLNDYLEKIISKKVINNSDVVLFDSRAGQIVSGLFQAYYNNPKLLHKGTLQRIFIETKRSCEDAIDFNNGDTEVIREEVNMIVNANLGQLVQKELMKEGEKKSYDQKRRILIRAITDYIAGMTDSYAMNEYKKICHP